MNNVDFCDRFFLHIVKIWKYNLRVLYLQDTVFTKDKIIKGEKK